MLASTPECGRCLGKGVTLRILVGSLKQESNTFSPVCSDLSSFESGCLSFDEASMTEMVGQRDEFAGFLEVCRQANADLVPTLVAWASSGGSVVGQDFNWLAEQFLQRVKVARNDIDGVLLALHGAWASEHHLDADGWLLSEVRKILGPKIPIVVTLDMHANVTTAMVEDADLLVGYRTYPHVDMFETGKRAANLLLDIVRGHAHPAMVACKVPMLVSPHSESSFEEPLSIVMEQLDRFEEQSSSLTASVFTVQPWLDVPELGSAIVIATNGNKEMANETANRLGKLLWDLRQEFRRPLLSPRDAVAQALEAQEGPVLLVDPADAVSAGSPGDGTAILSALLEARSECPALITLVDPEAARVAADADGQEITLTAGGRLDSTRNKPVTLTGSSRCVRAKCVTFGAGIHDGLTSDLGRAAVVKESNVHILLTEKSVPCYDPALYREVGLEPSDAHIVVVKSPSNFRWTYRDIARDWIYVDTPGASTPQLKTLKFEHAPHPLYPFEDWEWSPGYLAQERRGC